ncbi:hypothetical protein Sste5346_002291 [Sporothrix stenoceras]|uniref:Uncharacterized protein n=1 Tax=Sporothrix stenoceras TaxID=5173 RepID=A0ABR3ZL83_9PEZI
MAVAGPRHNIFHAYEVHTIQNIYDVFEMSGDYHYGQRCNVAVVRRRRAVREEAEAQARNAATWQDLESLRKKESEAVFQRQCRARLAEQESPHRLNMAILQAMVLSTEKPHTLQEFDSIFDRWGVQGITHQEGIYLEEKLYGFRKEERFPSGFVLPLEMNFPPYLGLPRILERKRPTNDAGMAHLFGFWDGKLNREQQNTLAKMYWLEARTESDYSEAEGERDEEKAEEDTPWYILPQVV